MMGEGNYDDSPIPSSNTFIQNLNWTGSIPVVLSLATTSLSSPSSPRPIHKMISRVTYLHVALHEEVMHMSRYAPAAAGLSTAFAVRSVEEPPDSPAERDGGVEGGGNCEVSDSAAEQEESACTMQSKGFKSSHDYFDCWFEDEASGIPLRWQLFVGVLYDLMKGKAVLNSSSGRGGTHDQHILPWRIRLHFTSYPYDRLLPLDDGSPPSKVENTNDDIEGSHRRITALVGRLFRNSLKQALFMQYGSSKVAMQITKFSHEKIWDSVMTSNYAAYHEVNADLQSGISSSPISSRSTDQDDQIDQLQLIPIRLMLNDRPAIQNPVMHRKDSTDIKRRPRDLAGDLAENVSSCRTPPYTTFGDFLSNICPNHFVMDPATGQVTSVPGSCHYYCIQGVQPSMKSPLVDLWRALSHPDHFLYIIVVTE
ncbi:hypothetical protein ACHAXA_001695 [Cyclostephanos tholiformis]|uniref:Autophagy protein 5 n=1 Tax=Cyclostephanos tholiformis TaxID=382380 RepID=A0ABD3RUC7_9STRA